jgi:hypothetical protein
MDAVGGTGKGEMRSAVQIEANSVTEFVMSSRISSRDREVSVI